MRRVYQTAKRVLIWLGEKNESTDLAVDMIDTLAANMDELDQQPLDTMGIDAVDEESRRSERLSTLIYPISEIPEATMEALRDIFLQRAWWSRIWVIQEVVRTLFLGRYWKNC
jgi:hypothetical protein